MVSQREREELKAEMAQEWPRLKYALTVSKSGTVDCDYFAVLDRMEGRGVPGEEQAQTWEELARFYEWRLERRTEELDPTSALHWILSTWTDSMCYSLRRTATHARGDDPGPLLSQLERRPDLWENRPTRTNSAPSLTG